MTLKAAHDTISAASFNFTGRAKSWYCYCIWSVVNVFDAVVLDLGMMMHWKRCRLPGTEDMDAEYKLLTKKSLVDGVYGCIIGIPVALLAGLVISLTGK